VIDCSGAPGKKKKSEGLFDICFKGKKLRQCDQTTRMVGRCRLLNNKKLRPEKKKIEREEEMSMWQKEQKSSKNG
jgi:hypothetical protein